MNNYRLFKTANQAFMFNVSGDYITRISKGRLGIFLGQSDYPVYDTCFIDGQIGVIWKGCMKFI